MKEKYDRIGIDYNLTRRADKYLCERFYHHLDVPDNRERRYMDIGCGTGNYSIALNEKGLDFIGIDPSEKMLRKARSRSDRVEWKQGSSEKIPLANGTVIGILASLTIHHWKDLKSAFGELSRVLQEDGKLVIFTSTPQQMKGYWLNHYFPEMRFSFRMCGYPAFFPSNLFSLYNS
jgi:ubiquinone/menaquinone biosynthesis C-methylase UbiE